MRRERFLKLAAGVVLAPYLARIPAGSPKVVPATVTSLTVSDGRLFRAGDVFRNISTGEALRVLKVDGSVLTVTRGVGMTPPTEMLPEDELLIVGTAAPSGSALQEGVFQPRRARLA